MKIGRSVRIVDNSIKARLRAVGILYVLMMS